MTVDWLKQAQEDYSNSPDGYIHEFRLSFAEFVIDRLRELGWSQKDVCEKLSVSEPLLSRLLSGDHNWTSASAGKIFWALKSRARVRPPEKKTPIEIPVEYYSPAGHPILDTSAEGFTYRGHDGKENEIQFKDFEGIKASTFRKRTVSGSKAGNDIATGSAKSLG